MVSTISFQEVKPLKRLRPNHGDHVPRVKTRGYGMTEQHTHHIGNRGENNIVVFEKIKAMLMEWSFGWNPHNSPGFQPRDTNMGNGINGFNHFHTYANSYKRKKASYSWVRVRFW